VSWGCPTLHSTARPGASCFPQQNKSSGPHPRLVSGLAGVSCTGWVGPLSWTQCPAYNKISAAVLTTTLTAARLTADLTEPGRGCLQEWLWWMEEPGLAPPALLPSPCLGTGLPHFLPPPKLSSHNEQPPGAVPIHPCPGLSGAGLPSTSRLLPTGQQAACHPAGAPQVPGSWPSMLTNPCTVGKPREGK
jgi:hypothetical protein